MELEKPWLRNGVNVKELLEKVKKEVELLVPNYQYSDYYIGGYEVCQEEVLTIIEKHLTSEEKTDN